MTKSPHAFDSESFVGAALPLLTTDLGGIAHVPEAVPSGFITEYNNTFRDLDTSEVLMKFVRTHVQEIDDLCNFVIHWATERPDITIDPRTPLKARIASGGIPLHRDLHRESPLVMSLRIDEQDTERRFISASEKTPTSRLFIDKHNSRGVPEVDIAIPNDEGIIEVKQKPRDLVILGNYGIHCWHMVATTSQTKALILAFNSQASTE